MKSRSKELLDRAISATVAAIEIYNKPDFPYRSETFCILAINGWELLLKAKWLNENGNRIQSLHVKEYGMNNDGSKSKRMIIKRSRAQIPFTHGLDYLAKRLVEQKHLDPIAKDNLEALLELRDISVHFFHQSDSRLAESLQEIGAASLKNFVLTVQEWFARDLSDFNFYLMPLSFVELPRQAEAIVLNREERNFLRYVQHLEEKMNRNDSEYVFMINYEVKLTRSKAKDVPEARITNNPNAHEFRMTEVQIRENYPWDFEELTDRCRKRYQDFKENAKFYDIRRPLLENEKFCRVRYLDPDNPKSAQKRFYNSNILQEFDKRYSRK